MCDIEKYYSKLLLYETLTVPGHLVHEWTAKTLKTSSSIIRAVYCNLICENITIYRCNDQFYELLRACDDVGQNIVVVQLAMMKKCNSQIIVISSTSLRLFYVSWHFVIQIQKNILLFT